MRGYSLKLVLLFSSNILAVACGKAAFAPTPIESKSTISQQGTDARPLDPKLPTPTENLPGLPALPVEPPEVVDLKPDDIFIEAESGILSGSQKMLVQASTGASSGKFLASSPLVPQLEDSHVRTPVADEFATYTFRVERERDFIISARVFAPSALQDSFWIQIDTLPTMAYHTAECIWPWANRWVWTDVKTLLPGDSISVNGISCLPTQQKTFRLAAGEHILRLRKRESLSLIDAILIKAL